MKKFNYKDVELLEISLTSDPADELAQVKTCLNKKDDQMTEQNNQVEQLSMAVADKEAEILNLKAQVNALKNPEKAIYTSLSGKDYFASDSEELVTMVKERDALSKAAKEKEINDSVAAMKEKLSNLPGGDAVLEELARAVVSIENAEVRNNVMESLSAQNGLVAQQFKEIGVKTKDELSGDPEDLETAFFKEAETLAKKKNISVEKARTMIWLSADKSEAAQKYFNSLTQGN
jgi:myosin heavy subunit